MSTSHSEQQLREVLNQGDWLWLRKPNADGTSKDYAVRLVPQATPNGLTRIERRWGRAIDGEGGTLKREERPPGSAVERALEVATAKLARGYEVWGRSPDLKAVWRDLDAGTNRQEEPSPSSTTDDTPERDVVYARIEVSSEKGSERVVQAIHRAARAVEEAMPMANRTVDLVVGNGRQGSLYALDGWLFGIRLDADAYAWDHYFSLVELPASGTAMVKASRDPLTALLFLLKAQREVDGSARFDVVDDAGTPVGDTRRDTDTLERLVSLWGTDTEALRPALEHLGLLAERVDLSAVTPAEVDGWF